MPVAPHEHRELDLILSGDKPLAAIEKAKQPEQFQRAADLALLQVEISGMYVDNGEEIIVVRVGDELLLEEYSDLLHFGVKRHGIKEYHRRMGKLFGYSPQDIEDFINAEVQCDCAKCNGA